MADKHDGLPDGLITFLLIVGLLSIKLFLILGCTTCFACFRTRKWRAEKRRRATLPQDDTADLPQDNEDQSDTDSDDSVLLDPDDTVGRLAREEEREEKAEDWHLSTWQKFRKEWKKAFGYYPGIPSEEKRERARHRRLVKDIAKRMIRTQRREDRRAARNGESSVRGDRANDVELPTYQKVLEEGETK